MAAVGRMQVIQNILAGLNPMNEANRTDFRKGFVDALGEGPEDRRRAFFQSRKIKGLDDTDAPRISSMLGTNPTSTRARDLLGLSDADAKEARRQVGIGLEKTPAGKAGQALGTIANDLTTDASRSIYWLLNAAQASANVVNEMALNRANPNLYKTDIVRDSNNRPVKRSNVKTAVSMGLMDAESQTLKRGVSTTEDEKGKTILTKRRFHPGHVATLGIPTGIAINTGLGLMTPFGGAEGYEAALPSQDDASKTSNVIGEVAAKYILGRTGNLLPYDEFKQVRPDVSREEYNRYKAFKYDKKADFNPLDGDVTLPTGILKYTNEGIHGPEVQFLGRSLPVTTGLLPYAGALLGGVAGVRTKRPIRGGFGGGMAGLAAGQITGNLIENERRKRNAAENAMELN